MAQPGDLLWVSAHFYGIKLVLERARKRKGPREDLGLRRKPVNCMYSTLVGIDKADHHEVSHFQLRFRPDRLFTYAAL
jgi:hypothetical protein